MRKAVIFDWDGTLADTQPTIVASFQKTLKDVNIHISDQFIERRIGMGTAETFKDILQETNNPTDELFIKQLVENKSQNQILLKDQVQLFPHSINLLETLLQNKAKVGLASMNTKIVIDNLTKAKGVAKYFQAVITADDVKQSKPHPEIFLKCAQQLNSPPKECTVIDDSLFGVKAAKNAGMQCIAVTTGVYTKEELQQENPDIIVTNLEQAKFYLLNNTSI